MDPQVTHNSVQLGYKSVVPMIPPPLGFEDLLEQLTEEREIHSPVYYIIMHMINDTDEQSDEEIPSVRSGRLLSARTSVPVALGYITLLVCGWFTHQEAPRTSRY